MALELTHDLPALADFIPLSNHQQETPSSFFGGKAVLHLRCPNAQIKISRLDLASQPEIASLQDEDIQESQQSSEDLVITDIDVWVASSYLALVSSAKAICVRIPYQTITVHAQEGSAVLLGLNLSDSNTADEDLVFVQFRIVPTAIDAHELPNENGHPHQINGNSSHLSHPAQALFQAIADCQELNPDPPEEGDEEYDETAPGATGWITSENMHDFLDENGQFRIPEGATVLGGEGEGDEDEEPEENNEPHWPLGRGAGYTRTHDELDSAEGGQEETKWQRTS